MCLPFVKVRWRRRANPRGCSRAPPPCCRPTSPTSQISVLGKNFCLLFEVELHTWKLLVVLRQNKVRLCLQLTPDKYSIYTNDYNNFISWLISNLPRPSVEKISIKNTWRKLYHPFVTVCSFNAISFITVTRQIYWTAAWAASAPPLTPQAKWRECRPPPPATRPTLLSRICLQNEHRHDQDWFPSQTFTTTTTRTRLDFLLASERLSLSLIATCWMSQKCFDGGSQRCGRVRCLTMKLEMSEDAEHQLL